VKIRLLSSVAVAIALGLVAVPVPAQADVQEWNYSANTGATYVKALGSTVQSDLTAQTFLNGGPSRSTSNSTASAKVEKLVTAGAAETRINAVKTGGNINLTSYARVAGVNLLNGLITADAVETTVTTVGNPDGTASATSNTRLLGLKIIGVNLPVDIPKNYQVTIPGIATVSLNYLAHASTPDLTATRAWALAVQLFKPRDGFNVGTTIILNPVNQYLQEAEPAGDAARLTGFAYSSRVHAKVGDQISILSDPTAYIGTPFDSSKGATLRNTTATATVPGLLTSGTLTSTSFSTRDSLGNAEIRNSSKTEGLNILGGLIKADAIEVTAQAKRQNGVWTQSLHMTTLNLVVAGTQIPVNVSPNTTINVANLGLVEINKQTVLPGQLINGIYGIKITLSTERAGLPVGAVIELAVAATGMTP